MLWKRRLRYLAGFLTFVFICVCQCCAQDKGTKRPADLGERSDVTKPIHVNVDLALVNVTVTDSHGRLVTGLAKTDFHIYEDGEEQEIRTFSSEDQPVSIGIVLDMSGSMSDKIEKARQAAAQFLKAANPRDEFFLVTFNDRARLNTHFTTAVDDLQTDLLYARAKGQTALFDGVYLGLTEMRDAHNARRAILIISDGGDNHSRYSETDLRRYVKEADCQLYAIGIYERRDMFRTFEELYGPTLLSEMTDLTGGQTFAVNSIRDLPDVATKIGMELRNQYVLGYKPSNDQHDGKWRKIKVQLALPRRMASVHVYARAGYYAPTP